MTDNHPYDPAFGRIIEEATETLMVQVPYNALKALLAEVAELKRGKPTPITEPSTHPISRNGTHHDEYKKIDGRRGPRPLRRGNTEEGAFCAVLADGGTFSEALDQTDWSEGKGRGKAAVFAPNIREMRHMSPDQRRAHLREFFGFGVAK